MSTTGVRPNTYAGGMAAQRLPFLDRSDPALWRALNGFSQKVGDAIDAAGIDRSALELLNVRISQLNGCAFCLDMHTRQALAEGATVQQLAQLSAWEDSTLFTETECAVLSVADATTLLPGPDERHVTLASARAVLGEQALTALEWAAINMNAYNRVSILSEHPVRERPASDFAPDSPNTPTR